MDGHTSMGLRVLLLVYAVYSALYGLAHVLVPEAMGAKDPAIERVLGTAVLAFAFGAGLAYMERAWSRVRIVVLSQIAWTCLYTLTMAWGILAGGIDAIAWAPTVISALFAAAFVVLYRREESASDRRLAGSPS